MKIIRKPAETEFQTNEPMLAKLIPGDGALSEHLETNLQATKKFILDLPAEKLSYKYREDKWNVKEILSHMIDMERIYTYRMLRFARNDNRAMEGFDADTYVLASNANHRDAADLLKEFESVRAATISLLNSIPPEAFHLSGTANGRPVSVSALAYHIAGHELHHINVIKEKYL